MVITTSEKRLTRSQARAGSSVVASKTPHGASTPSSAATPITHSFSRAGRRVLAELACNDSPVIGLLPAGTPFSCKDKSSDGAPTRSRRALLADPAAPLPACTPLGESLLRSQVHMLLQKVESEMYPRHFQKPPFPHMGIAAAASASASPAMTVAPTPLNTPASVVMSGMPLPRSECSIDVNSQGTAGDVAMQDAGVPPPVAANILDEHTVVHGTMDLKCDVASADTHCLEPVVTSLCAEVMEMPSSSEIFFGKRVLHFDEDTPCKSSEEKLDDDRASSFEEVGHGTLSVRQLDDDEVSEWSMHVNVGSPAAEGALNEHVEMIQQVSSTVVHLLWDQDSESNEFQQRRDVDEPCEEGEEDENVGNDESFEEYYGDEEVEDGVYDVNEECDDLCDMFRGMGVGGARKALPRGEGRHTRFLYEEDGEEEIVEAIVVRGEEDVSCNGRAIRLRGIPAPLGRHSRFEDDEDGENE